MDNNYLFEGGLENLARRGTQYPEKWVASYDDAAIHKSKLEKRLGIQVGTEVEVRNLDHPLTYITTNGNTMTTPSQATYGSGE